LEGVGGGNGGRVRVNHAFSCHSVLSGGEGNLQGKRFTRKRNEIPIYLEASKEGSKKRGDVEERGIEHLTTDYSECVR